jgi:hypothetical protein
VREILDAILADDPAALAGLPVPETYRAAVLLADEQDMFAGMASADKDPRKSCTCGTYPPRKRGRTGEAGEAVYRGRHEGEVGVLCLSPGEGLGVRDPELRGRHEPAINRFRARP